jgi:hypothetical protein
MKNDNFTKFDSYLNGILMLIVGGVFITSTIYFILTLNSKISIILIICVTIGLLLLFLGIRQIIETIFNWDEFRKSDKQKLFELKELNRLLELERLLKK